MKLKFKGNYRKLKATVLRTGLGGFWRELENGQKQYRTAEGGILNWWETTGTITFQGHDGAAKEELKRTFLAIASAKKRLFGECDGRIFTESSKAYTPTMSLGEQYSTDGAGSASQVSKLLEFRVPRLFLTQASKPKVVKYVDQTTNVVIIS